MAARSPALARSLLPGARALPPPPLSGLALRRGEAETVNSRRAPPRAPLAPSYLRPPRRRARSVAVALRPSCRSPRRRGRQTRRREQRAARTITGAERTRTPPPTSRTHLPRSAPDPEVLRQPLARRCAAPPPAGEGAGLRRSSARQGWGEAAAARGGGGLWRLPGPGAAVFPSPGWEEQSDGVLLSRRGGWGVPRADTRGRRKAPWGRGEAGARRAARSRACAGPCRAPGVHQGRGCERAAALLFGAFRAEAAGKNSLV